MEGVRLITMTSAHSPEVVESSKQAGAVACLPKPLDVQQVLDLFRVPLALGAAPAVKR
jgi:AmiR/NasT family two-component response regulator